MAGQVDEPHAVWILVTNRTSDLQRQARLPYAAGPRERQQTDIGQQSLELCDLGPSADECSEPGLAGCRPSGFDQSRSPKGVMRGKVSRGARRSALRASERKDDAIHERVNKRSLQLKKEQSASMH